MAVFMFEVRDIKNRNAKMIKIGEISEVDGDKVLIDYGVYMLGSGDFLLYSDDWITSPRQNIMPKEEALTKCFDTLFGEW